VGEIRTIRAGHAAEIPPGQMKAVNASPGLKVIVANVGGQYYAFAGRCPHRGGPLHEGTVWGDVIECPWHHYRFHIPTGENIFPRSVYPCDLPHLLAGLPDLQTYKVTLEAGTLVIEIPHCPSENPPAL